MKIRDLIPWGRDKNDASDKYESKGRALTNASYDGAGSLTPIQEELNGLFERFFERFERPFMGSALTPIGAAFASPQLDISETDKAVTISIDLPGMSEDDVDVTLTGDVLTVRGERKQERENKDGGMFVHERSFGSFYRTVPLPPGLETEKAEASFKNGVLDVKLPKSEKARNLTKRIKVKAA